MDGDFPAVDYVVCPVCAWHKAQHEVFMISSRTGIGTGSLEANRVRSFTCTYGHHFEIQGELISPFMHPTLGLRAKRIGGE